MSRSNEVPSEIAAADCEKDGNDKTEYSYEEALVHIGFGKVQLIVLIISGICLMAVINETVGMSIISLSSLCDLETDTKKRAILSASGFIGIFLSSHMWGYLADTTGRRNVMMISVFISNFFSFLSMFATNYWVFVVLRFFSGVGISGPSACVYAYIGEFNTNKFRPVITNYASFFVGLSNIFIPAIPWIILPNADWSFNILGLLDFRPWRLIILCYLLPGFIGACCLKKFVPESPRFFLARGRDQEALDIIHWIYETNTGHPREECKIRKLSPEITKDYLETLSNKKTCIEIVKSMWKQTSPLFKPPYLLYFSMCCTVEFGLFFIGGMGLWYPEISNRLGSSDNSSAYVCEIIGDSEKSRMADSLNLSYTRILEDCDDSIKPQTYFDTMTIGFVYVIGYIIIGFIINPLGRKAVLALCIFGSGAAGLLLHWVNDPLTIVVAFALFIALPGLCISIIGGIVCDLIPTHLRGMAVCICLMLGRFGSVVGSNVIGLLINSHCILTFYLFSGFIIFCGVLTLFIPS